jgi:hypothetical protein
VFILLGPAGSALIGLSCDLHARLVVFTEIFKIFMEKC